MKRWLLLLTLLTLPSAFAEMREWKTADGEKTITAEYVRSENGKVTILRQSDRRTFTFDLAKLSEADQAWVKQKEEEAPANEDDAEADGEFAKLLTGNWERTEGHDLKYRIYGDRKLRRAKDAGYPLVIYLHGRSGDVMSPNAPGQASSFSNDDNYRKRPCFIIAPQCPDENGWIGSKADSVLKIIEELVKKLPIDKKRIYLTGYSMGGYGTFHLLAQEPKLFAAGIPIAGGGNPSSAGSFKKVPIWVFHGAKDPTVPVQQSRTMVEALKKERAEPKYTEFPDGNHGIANQVYADQAVHEWLFEQTQ
ncbi:MAG: prolyl oligopeptidase family serine peptidase [Verrucomicrobia bacterium]|nr:prolyl oligopeptidase family serine peptidase [Verrucomicrobiota bacterium]